ncbi:MAG: hypothetical protein ACREVL_02045 [Solimonas sp.]
MRTHVEFSSGHFPAYPDEADQINPGRFGRRLAEFVGAGLSQRGWRVHDIGAEDWGWRVELEHAAFALWIGCGNYDDFDDGFLCFIEPSKPLVRRWLRRIDTTAAVEKLAGDLADTLERSGKASRLRWWAEGEAR